MNKKEMLRNTGLSLSFGRRSMISKSLCGIFMSITYSGCSNLDSSKLQYNTYSNNVSYWINRGTVKYRLVKNAVSVECLEWRSDSQRIAWRSSNGPGYIFDLQNGKYTALLPAPQSINTSGALIWIPDTNVLLMGGDTLDTPDFSQTAITIVDSDTGDIVRRVNGLIKPHQDRDHSTLNDNMPLSRIANCAAQIFIDNDNIVVRPHGGLSGFEVFDNELLNSNIETIPDLPAGRSCDLKYNSSEAVFSGPNGEFIVADRNIRKVTYKKHAHPADTWLVKYSPDGKTLITGMLSLAMGRNDQTKFDVKDSERHKIKSWNTSDYSYISSIDIDMNICSAVAFHPSGEIFFAASRSEIFAFDTITMSFIQKFPCPIENIIAISFSPNGAWLAVAGIGGVVCLMSP